MTSFFAEWRKMKRNTYFPPELSENDDKSRKMTENDVIFYRTTEMSKNDENFV